ncbi:Carboxylesterase NlhH [Pigmentiphaga humi]|uniref:Carboxylesterase NlhH n=1 Tax=Pigmentiphaga humi TaxID=2478468 RepID=A0A3P4AYS7_9BURK|nr:alpha/beta hydrolase [Pigmentiphaga humi]VCU69183.1 Carboxylesterase NlhH [Pigmentiphaga humi]
MSTPLDPQLAAIVAALRARGAPPPFSGSAPQARARMTQAIMQARQRHPLPEVGRVRNVVAQHGGVSVPVRIYEPPAASGPLPIVVFFHGGGFVLGSVELMDDIARKLCRDLRAIVVSVDYRLAPEHPYPAAHDDALAATLWASAHATQLGGSHAQVAIAGESAGANLAASAALQCRTRGLRLAAQLLVVPGVDMARDTRPLERPGGDDYPMLTPADLRDIARLYMGSRMDEAAGFPPSPLRAADLSGLPATVIALAGHDPLYGEGQAYGARLAAAGVATRILRFEDMFHPFFGFFEASESARRANDTICEAFGELLHGSPAPHADNMSRP